MDPISWNNVLRTAEIRGVPLDAVNLAEVLKYGEYDNRPVVNRRWPSHEFRSFWGRHVNARDAVLAAELRNMFNHPEEYPDISYNADARNNNLIRLWFPGQEQALIQLSQRRDIQVAMARGVKSVIPAIQPSTSISVIQRMLNASLNLNPMTLTAVNKIIDPRIFAQVMTLAMAYVVFVLLREGQALLRVLKNATGRVADNVGKTYDTTIGRIACGISYGTFDLSNCRSRNTNSKVQRSILKQRMNAIQNVCARRPEWRNCVKYGRKEISLWDFEFPGTLADWCLPVLATLALNLIISLGLQRLRRSWRSRETLQLEFSQDREALRRTWSS